MNLRLRYFEDYVASATSLIRSVVCQLIAMGFFVCPLYADDWKTFRGDPQCQGAATNGSMTDTPELLWEYHVPKGCFESTPIIVGDRVFLPDRDGEIHCLSLTDGKVIWKSVSDLDYMASAAYLKDVLVVGDSDGGVHGLNPEDGKERWTFSANGPVHVGANSFGDMGLITSNDGFLSAFNIETGEVLWQYTIENQLQCGVSIGEDRTFLAGCDGELHRVNLVDGSLIGEKIPLGDYTTSTPARQGDLVIVPNKSGRVLGINWRTGKVEWTFKDEERSPEILSSPAVTSELALVTTRARRLLAVDIKTGKLSWEAIMSGRKSESSPIVVGDRVWVGASDGRLYAFDLKTGDEVWQTELEGGFKGSPAFASNRLVIAADNGSVFCFGAKGR